MRSQIGCSIISEELNRLYPSPKPFLNFRTPYQLLVAVILSAQCTDKRVNIVTKKLFQQCPGPKEILALGTRGLIPSIRSCTYFNAKARHIIGMTKIILEKYKGQIPKKFDVLIELPGVGEKTAGVLLSQAFGIPAFPVDTHVFRVARRLGLSKEHHPNKVSRDLQKLFPRERWGQLTKQMILHGRTLCMARKPKCQECPLLSICPEGKKRVRKE